MSRRCRYQFVFRSSCVAAAVRPVCRRFSTHTRHRSKYRHRSGRVGSDQIIYGRAGRGLRGACAVPNLTPKRSATPTTGVKTTAVSLAAKAFLRDSRLTVSPCTPHRPRHSTNNIPPLDLAGRLHVNLSAAARQKSGRWAGRSERWEVKRRRCG